MSVAGINVLVEETRAAAAGAPLLTIRGVKTFYGNIMALKGVDLDVREGEIVTLIGANGAGKSTLMMTIFGNPRAREGTITYAGREALGRSALAARPHPRDGQASRAARPRRAGVEPRPSRSASASTAS